MFTGLVEARGEITELETIGGAAKFTLSAPFAATLKLGDSVAVSGVCLSVIALTAETFTVDVMPETLQMTTLGELKVGAQVNLERALALGDRLDGHLVQGHVDGCGVISDRRGGTRWDDVDIDCSQDLARYIAYKGSIAVDGVSLTVSKIRDSGFTVSLIPTTLAQTTLGNVKPGSKVNLETDMMARYLERLITATKDTTDEL